MDGLSPETRALLDRASEGDRLDDARREALRWRVAAALGVVGASIPRGTASTHGAPTWVLRALSALGATGAAVAVAVHLHGAVAARPVTPVEPTAVAPAAVASAAVDAPAAPAPGVLATPAPEAPGKPAALTSPATSSRAARANPPGAASRSRDSLAGRPAEPTGDALSAETRLVASAQSALDQGQAGRALGWLDEHDRRFPDGPLAPESEALRVDALCAVGRAHDARAEALRWSASHPGSPARRLPASCSRDVE